MQADETGTTDEIGNSESNDRGFSRDELMYGGAAGGGNKSDFTSKTINSTDFLEIVKALAEFSGVMRNTSKPFEEALKSMNIFRLLMKKIKKRDLYIRKYKARGQRGY